MGWEDIAKNLLGGLPLSTPPAIKEALDAAPPEARRAIEHLTESLLRAARNMDGAAAPEPRVAQPREETVFVVHGPDASAWQALRDFVSALGLSAHDERTFERQGLLPPPRSAHETLKKAFLRAQSVIVLLTPDVQLEATPNTSAVWQPSAQVLVQAGLALGMHPSRTVLIKFPGVHIPLELESLIAVAVHADDLETRERIVGQLRATDLHIPDVASERLMHGDFQSALQPRV